MPHLQWAHWRGDLGHVDGQVDLAPEGSGASNVRVGRRDGFDLVSDKPLQTENAPGDGQLRGEGEITELPDKALAPSRTPGRI